jgi:hypothetical protein
LAPDGAKPVHNPGSIAVVDRVIRTVSRQWCRYHHSTWISEQHHQRLPRTTLKEPMPRTTKDRHVLAAAVRGSADVVVTFNTSGFAEAALKPYDVSAVHPGEFLLDQLDLHPGPTVEVLHQQAAAYRMEPTTVPGVLMRPEQSGVPRFAEVRRHIR